ncbi:uncharacterized protein LOC114352714 [Ostrinia furnacalis]|uniref:uncharacterized protein LOC114352714 n=1 Tax=Ostrinia furnacalis TaxID=93504 RepID=UPI00103FD0DE|nr:uncharacterized protein LOC114352714 [Ostrinia furnacalis]
MFRPSLIRGASVDSADYGVGRSRRASLSAEQRRRLSMLRTSSIPSPLTPAGTPPWELEAHVQAAVYRWMAAQKERGEHPAFEEREAVRCEARETVVQQWADHLAVAESGRRTLDALAPTIERWLERPHGYLSFHLVQMLTGNGCFGSYLYRIGREETPSCHACRGGAEDTAHHTLAVCPAWAP